MDKTNLINKMLFYGVTPRSNWIKFSKTNEETFALQVHYVFDRETHEYEDFSFTLSNEDVDTLMDNLDSKSYAKLEKEKLFFEWRWNDNNLEIKMDCKSNSPFSGSLRYYMPDFAVIHGLNRGNI